VIVATVSCARASLAYGYAHLTPVALYCASVPLNRNSHINKEIYLIFAKNRSFMTVLELNAKKAELVKSI